MSNARVFDADAASAALVRVAGRPSIVTLLAMMTTPDGVTYTEARDAEVSEGKTDVEIAGAVFKVHGVKSQGDVAAVTINATIGMGKSLDNETLTEVLSAAFPHAKIGKRHGGHYMSMARKSKLKGLLDISVIPHSRRSAPITKPPEPQPTEPQPTDSEMVQEMVNDILAGSNPVDELSQCESNEVIGAVMARVQAAINDDKDYPVYKDLVDKAAEMLGIDPASDDPASDDPASDDSASDDPASDVLEEAIQQTQSIEDMMDCSDENAIMARIDNADEDELAEIRRIAEINVKDEPDINERLVYQRILQKLDGAKTEVEVTADPSDFVDLRDTLSAMSRKELVRYAKDVAKVKANGKSTDIIERIVATF